MATNRFVTTSRGLAAALAVALLAACQPSLEEVIAEHRPAVEGVFKQISALTPVLDEASALPEDRVDTGGDAVVLEGDAANALFILGHDVASPDAAGAEGLGATHASTIATCAEALRGEFDGVAKGAALFLKECAAARYVFVLRTFEEQLAQVNGTDSFEPGYYHGEVRVFRLADGADLGGFRIRAESSDQVSVEVDASGNPIDPTERLNSDLSAMVFVAIQQKLREHVPGSIPPA